MSHVLSTWTQLLSRVALCCARFPRALIRDRERATAVVLYRVDAFVCSIIYSYVCLYSVRDVSARTDVGKYFLARPLEYPEASVIIVRRAYS